MAKRRLPKVLSEREVAELLEHAPTERDRVILSCGLLLGLRVSEITKLQIEHVDLDQGVVLVAQGKGDKDRYVPIPGRLFPPLLKWIGERQTGYVFPSPRGGHLSSDAVQYMIRETAHKAGVVRRVTPHMMRHTYATTLLNRGANLREVQELLGHSSVATTEIYTHVAIDRLKGVVDRL